ncbi:MAG: hypothetical protein HY916_10760 [Desulfovibrio sp.]|jgi:hypothetical protein|nr:hypothetical protein [Desulfovibrio sp.]
MPSNSEYAQRQFRTEAAGRAEREIIERELRELRGRLRALEEKVAFLTSQISSRKADQDPPRGFS